MTTDRRTAAITRRLAKLSVKQLESLLQDHLRSLGAKGIKDAGVIETSTRHIRAALAQARQDAEPVLGDVLALRILLGK